MAIIKCLECTNDVSDKASACPKCGAPLSATPSPQRSVVTTEQTGKKYKAIQTVGVLMICASTVACVGHNIAATSFLGGVGMIVWIAGRVGAWWDHG